MMTFSRRELLLAGAGLAASPLAASLGAERPKPAANAPVDFARLDLLVEQAVAMSRSPGIALVLWKDGKEIYSRYAGWANLETRTPVSATSVFRIGSLTKQFAAAALVRLAGEGRVSLSDPVHRYLPFLSAQAPFTIRELLNHTAGVHDGDYDTAALAAPSQIDLAQRLAAQKPFFDFPPGTAWLYSNANYLLAGALIEKIADRPLADAANALLLQPLGLEHTAFDTPADIVSGRVSGYSAAEASDPSFRNAEYLDVALAGAAGAMRSTASDLCRWHHVLFQGDALPSSVRDTMLMPGRLRSGQLASTHRFSENDKPMGNTEYGLGLMLDRATTDQSLIVGHHGGINGFASYLATHVASGLTFACLCNIDTHPGLPLRDIRRTVFAGLLATPKA